MDKPMNFIHLTSDKLIELGSLCSVSDGSDKTFTDDFDVMQTIPCLEQPALKHVVLCVSRADNTCVTSTYHNVRMTKDIWNSGILISKSFTKIDINDEPDEYADGKVIGQRWLAMAASHWSNLVMRSSCWPKGRKAKLLTIYARPSISSPTYVDILLPKEQEGTEFLYNQLVRHISGDVSESYNLYDAICGTFVNYIVANRILLSNGGKYHKTGSKVSKSSILSTVKRTLPGKVSLKNIDIDVDAFIVDHPPKKHDEANNDAVKTWHCPAWEVRGHYRHYKSGKVTYVKPHTKGKLRDTLVIGREYDLDVKCKE